MDSITDPWLAEYEATESSMPKRTPGEWPPKAMPAPDPEPRRRERRIVSMDGEPYESPVEIALLDGPAIEAAEWGEPEYLIDRLLPRPGMSLAGAGIKLGKATLATQIGIAVACGDDFMGRTTRKGRTVYLALEDEGGNPAMVRERLRTMGWRPALDFLLGFDGPGETPPGEWLRALVERYEPALVVTDMLGGLLKPPDGNDYHHVRECVRPVREAIAGTQVHVLMLHHHRKAGGEHGEGMLGSTAWAGAVDTVIELHREKDGGRAISTTQRYGTAIETSLIRFDPDTRESILLSTKREARHTETVDGIIERILDRFASNPEPATLTMLRAELGGSNAHYKPAISQMLRGGFLRFERPGGARLVPSEPSER